MDRAKAFAGGGVIGQGHRSVGSSFTAASDLLYLTGSVGILTILISQKTTGDAIPTFIRDVCPVGLSFAQKTVEAAVAALGDDIRNWLDASPVILQDPAYVGVAVMAMQERPGFTASAHPTSPTPTQPASPRTTHT
ncbi:MULTISPECIES: hypothetical protein [unclassified Streptomyces]|uniref:hypothetical protein n=1 Tax=unclassified Streptomyces TaxID=2593676 RepID=UPI0036773009